MNINENKTVYLYNCQKLLMVLLVKNNTFISSDISLNKYIGL